jgi:hypothetical protein
LSPAFVNVYRRPREPHEDQIEKEHIEEAFDEAV